MGRPAFRFKLVDLMILVAVVAFLMADFLLLKGERERQQAASKPLANVEVTLEVEGFAAGTEFSVTLESPGSAPMRQAVQVR
ncbi:MAG TPA: hypothetical protein VGZ22_04880 [Isosphaeraceae bacterium]|jgi:hypothetical protein|nr:hypothetical protein [Isosphaeraceae bacterium]